MELFLEDYFSEEPFEVITESTKLPKGVLMVVNGPIGITETKNLNGRVYTNDFWETVLSREGVKKDIKERALVGSADHPKSFIPPMAAISHVLVEAHVSRTNNTLYGKSEVVSLPMGKIVKQCYDAKLKVGASTRGGGMTKNKNGADYVLEKDYRWGGFDFCFRPSAQNAFPKPIKESVEQIMYEATLDEIGETEDSKEFFERVLKNFGCNVSIIKEKYVTRSFYIVPASYKVEKSLYYNDEFSVVESNGEIKLPKESIKVDSGFFNSYKNMKEKVLTLSDRILDIAERTLPPGDIENLQNEIEQKNTLVTSLKESGELSEGQVREFRTLYLSVQGQLDTAKSLMGDKLIAFQRTVENFEDSITALKLENEETESLSIALKEQVVDLEEKLRKKGTSSTQITELRNSNSKLHRQKQALSGSSKELTEEVIRLRKLYYSLKAGIPQSDIESEGVHELTLDEYNESFKDLSTVGEKVNVFGSAPEVKSFRVTEKSPKKKSQITSILEIMGGNK